MRLSKPAAEPILFDIARSERQGINESSTLCRFFPLSTGADPSSFMIKQNKKRNKERVEPLLLPLPVLCDLIPPARMHYMYASACNKSCAAKFIHLPMVCPMCALFFQYVKQPLEQIDKFA